MSDMQPQSTQATGDNPKRANTGQYGLQNSLAITALRSLVLPITIAILAITLFAYAYFYGLVKQQNLDNIVLFSKERVKYELEIFKLAEDNLVTARNQLTAELAISQPEQALRRFGTLTRQLADGTYRSPPEKLDRDYGTQTFVAKNSTISDRMAQVISASSTVLSHAGPAWRNRFPNLYFVGKEDYAVIYWAGEYIIGNLSGDFTHLNKGFYLIGTPEQNPEAVNKWTSAYLSVSGLNKWMVSSITPVYDGPDFLGILGQDIYLDNLMTRTIKDHPDGAKNMLITQDGKLIAHPDFMSQITQSKDGLDVANQDDASLRHLYQLIVQSIPGAIGTKGQTRLSGAPVVIEDKQFQRYLVVTPMAEMGWLLITEYPKTLISQLAFRSSRTVLILGAVLLIIELFVLFMVIRRQISTPLENLGVAANQWDSENPQFTFEQYQHRKDEIGYLTRKFLDLKNTVNEQFARLRAEIERRKSVERDLENQGNKLLTLNENLDFQVKERTKDLEQEVKEHNLLSAAIDHAAESIMITNCKFEIEYVNQAFKYFSGYGSEEVIGQTPMSLNRMRGDPATQQQILSTLRKGEVWSGQISNINKQGEIRHEEATMSPIRNAAGEITHYIEVKRDITEKIELEQQLNNAHKLEAIGQLAAGIAHEINTPTQFIGDNTRFLKEAYDDFDTVIQRVKQLPESGHKEYINQAIKEADIEYLVQEIPNAIEQSQEGIERVSGIVRAMKDFAHPSREKAPTDINRAIQNTITVTMNEWRYVADLQTDFADDLPNVNCEQGEINQVLLNIITNAAHAIEEAHGDGNKGTILISTANQNGFVSIKIKDNGTGMSAQVRERIFDPFFTTREVGKGIGQGLNMAYKVIVTDHGGQIHVDSEPGNGTCFTINLPTESEAPDIAI